MTFRELIRLLEEDGRQLKPSADAPKGTAANILRQAGLRIIREAISFHLDGLRQAGQAIPAPTAVGTTLVEVPAA